MKASPISVNAEVSDDAANTVMSPSDASFDAGAALELFVCDVAALSDPHDAHTTASTATTDSTSRRVLRIVRTLVNCELTTRHGVTNAASSGARKRRARIIRR